MDRKIQKALLIVDVQNDFCPGGALAVPNGDEVIESLNRLTDKAKEEGWLMVASRDWHPNDTRHFSQFGGKWPGHCVQHSWGARFHPKLKVDGLHTIVISKGLGLEDAYSAFDGFFLGQPLEKFLKSSGVLILYVGGLATDYCVKATAIDAVRKGFVTFLVLDACRAVNINPSDGDDAVREMLENGVVITSSDGVLKTRERGGD